MTHVISCSACTTNQSLNVLQTSSSDNAGLQDLTLGRSVWHHFYLCVATHPFAEQWACTAHEMNSSHSSHKMNRPCKTTRSESQSWTQIDLLQGATSILVDGYGVSGFTCLKMRDCTGLIFPQLNSKQHCQHNSFKRRYLPQKTTTKTHERR